jgi:ABC-type multidrug transport system ATPase subunit
VLLGAGRGHGRAEARVRGRSAAAALDWPNSGRAGVARHRSGGTRQKLNLVLSELGDPDVLLLDQPYQGPHADGRRDGASRDRPPAYGPGAPGLCAYAG